MAPRGNGESPARREAAGGAGICISGGGIRAAAFGLGALQVLGDKGILGRAKYLSAVSGGSYIAAAIALVTRGQIRPEEDDDGIVTPGGDMRAFSRGSPEEGFLRNNLRYLSHGPGGTIAVAGRVLFGLLLNLVFLAFCLWLVALAVGWAYGWLIPALRGTHQCVGPVPKTPNQGCVVNFHAASATWWTVVALAAAGGLAGLVWAGFAWRRPVTRRIAGAVTGGFLLAAGLVLLFAIGIPYALAFFRGTLAQYPSSTAMTTSQSSAVGSSNSALWAGVSGGLVGTIASVFGWIRTAMAKATPSEQAVQKGLRKFVGDHRTFFINALAAIAGPLLAVALALLIINYGAAHVPFVPGAARWEWAKLVVPAAGLAIVYYFADLNRWSLHPYYKQHLTQAFGLARVTSHEGSDSTTKVRVGKDKWEDARARRHECPFPISESQPSLSEFPTVLYCATANVTDYGKVPTGFDATSFVFSAQNIGGPMVGWCPASKYQDAGERATVPTAIAVAGAAVSPEMGKMTRAPLRFLMTVFNLRLGVWLPNPVHAKDEQGRYGMPRPHHLFAELFGLNRLRSRFLYVTDGGHYENLGLVELLRRRCTTIYCIDGSGEKMDQFDTIGQAFALARAELGITMTMDPRADMGPEPNGPSLYGHEPKIPLPKSLFSIGTIEYPPAERYPYYPDVADDGARSGRLVVVKAGVTENAPYDIRSYQEDHPSFPCDSTLNQLFTAERFDAYRALGEYAMTQAEAGLTGQSAPPDAKAPAPVAPAGDGS